MWDVASGSQTLALAGHTAYARDVEFVGDTGHLVSVGADRRLRWWDTRRSPELQSWSGEDTVGGFELSPDGTQFAVNGLHELSIVDVASGLPRHQWSSEQVLSQVEFSPDGQRIAYGYLDGSTVVRDLESGDNTFTLDEAFDAEVGGLAFTPDSSRLVVAHTAGGDGIGAADLRMMDLKTGRDVWQETSSTGGAALSISPDGKTIVVGGYSDSSGADSNSLVVRDAATGQENRRLAGHASYLTRTAFSPDGRKIASAAFEPVVLIWDTDTWTVRQRLTGIHQAGLWGLAFSPDGRRLVTGGEDGRVGLWEVARGDALATLFQSKQRITGVAFSGDGRVVYAADASGVIHALLADTAELATLARSRLTRTFTTEECRQYLHVEACPADEPRPSQARSSGGVP
jgi:WD40 repeat protein